MFKFCPPPSAGNHKNLPAGRQGFTLIELLVVIAIIAILSTIGFAVFSGVQKGARDAKRKLDLDALSKAVLLYHQANGSWPNSGNGACSSQTGQDWPASFKTDLAPYMSGDIPVDPNNGAANACSGSPCRYCYSSNMWCAGFSGPSCSTGIANFYTYQENCTSNQIGDSARFGYGCPHFMKSIDPL